MKIGIIYPQTELKGDPSAVKRIGVAAEELGFDHLLGYDHAEPEEEKEMFALQRQLLEEWVEHQVEAYRQDRQSDKDRRLLYKSRYFDQP